LLEVVEVEEDDAEGILEEPVVTATTGAAGVDEEDVADDCAVVVDVEDEGGGWTAFKRSANERGSLEEYPPRPELASEDKAKYLLMSDESPESADAFERSDRPSRGLIDEGETDDNPGLAAGESKAGEFSTESVNSESRPDGFSPVNALCSNSGSRMFLDFASEVKYEYSRGIPR
jgi:hypothetical protein